MPDINCHSKMKGYHDKEVTLNNTQQGDMRRRRNAGRTRLETGLNEHNKPQPKFIHSQGSYQMRTMVQDADNEYDIDDGVYFNESDLIDDDGADLTPLQAREMVCAALSEDKRLKVTAEVHRNCVRQEYPEGYHIDMPVYRIVTETSEEGEDVEVYHLASADSWAPSDARAVTKWFNDRVGELNSEAEDGSQMRRIVKLTKKYSRSRPEWKEATTSGICLTKLVYDHFVESADRDDLSLRETWKAILTQLDKSTEIVHPVLDDKLAKSGDQKVLAFRGHLRAAITSLDALDDKDCTEEEAMAIWDTVFDTDHFSGGSNNGGNDSGGSSKTAAIISSSESTARRDDNNGRFG